MLLSSGVFQLRPPMSLPQQAYAETSPQTTVAYFAPHTGLQFNQFIATYGLMYRVQPHLFSAIDKIANLIAKLSVGVYNTTPDSGDVLDRTGPYAQLMRDPCMTLPRYDFYHWVSTTFEIYGEAYLLKNRTTGLGIGNGKILSLVPMHPVNTYIKRAENGALLYGFTGRPDEWFDEDQVIPIRSYNPDNTMRGLSRMEPLRTTLMQEDSMRKASKSLWDNMLRPSYVLSTPKVLTEPGFKRLEKAVQSVSGAEGAGGALLLEDDVTATRMQLDAEEMQYIDSRKLSRSEVFEVYDVNPAVLQINDNTTATAWPAMTKDVYKSSVDHRLQKFQSSFDFYVGSEFNGPKEFRFEVNNQLRADLEVLAPAVVQLVQSFVLMPSEARVWLSLPDAGVDADQLFGNTAMTSLKLLLNPPEPPTLGGGQAIPQSTSSNNSNPNPNGDLPKRVPALTDKAKGYMNDIFAGLGRGKTWEDLAFKMMERNPQDRNDIQVACLHLLMRQNER